MDSIQNTKIYNSKDFILKMKYDFFMPDHSFSSYYISSYIVAKIRQLIKQRKIPSKYHNFIYYIAMYLRIFITGSFSAYYLSDAKNEQFANQTIAIMENSTEVDRILKKIESLIDITIQEIQALDSKYSTMAYNQLAALAVFEDKLKENYLNEKE